MNKPQPSKKHQATFKPSLSHFMEPLGPSINQKLRLCQKGCYGEIPKKLFRSKKMIQVHLSILSKQYKNYFYLLKHPEILFHTVFGVLFIWQLSAINCQPSCDIHILQL